MITYECQSCQHREYYAEPLEGGVWVLSDYDCERCGKYNLLRMRPGWDDYFLDICLAVAQRADCRRAQHGAVIVQGKRVVATGYNGSPAGSPLSCLKGDCPRGLLSYEELQSLTGGYDECIAIHAESNALVHSNRVDCIDATIYVTGKPCPGCEKLIRASGIRRVVWPTGSFWV